MGSFPYIYPKGKQACEPPNLPSIARLGAMLARKVDALERKYDAQFKGVFDAIRMLMEPPRVTG